MKPVDLSDKDDEQPIRTILVIEDEQELRGMLVQMLSKSGGFKIHSATDGADALRKLPKLPDIDAVVSDFKMPKTNGLEFLAELHTQGLQIPVVLISAYADNHLFREAIRLGVVDFLEKPFHSAEIIPAVRRAAEIGHMTRELAQAIEQHASPELLEKFQELSIFRHFLNRLPLNRAS